MKILVTGSSGFVGSHLLPFLRSQGNEVVGIGHLPNAKADPSYKVLDLLDAAAIDAFDFAGIDAVIHLAGLAAVGPSFEQPRRYLDANAGMQINLFEALLKQKITPRMLVISTGGVYQGGKLPITEDTPITPPNPYAVSKLAQEFLAQYYGGRGFEVLIARPFNHIGVGQTEGFIAPDLAKQIVAAETATSPELHVGDLSSRRDYTAVNDIVRAYWLLLKQGTPGEVYNVCSGRSTSGQEILDGLLKHSKVTPRIIQDEDKVRPADLKDTFGSCAKLHRDTGWKPTISLDQSLGEVLQDWRQRLAS